jgi:hypothetical protein
MKIINRFTGEILLEVDSLKFANLTGANLKFANLTGANLTGANLKFANLREADLREANLKFANLTGADLTGADLREADLTKANLDFACWPLWCGSIRVQIDKKLAAQLIYHAITVGRSHLPELSEDLIEFANTFHRVKTGEVPKL